MSVIIDISDISKIKRSGWWNVSAGMPSEVIKATLKDAPRAHYSDSSVIHLNGNPDVESTRSLRSGKRSSE